METIRPFTPDDVEQTANLFLKVFRKKSSPASESLKKTFASLYFEHPWYRKDMPSLIYESSEGTIAGFFGVLPMCMSLGKRTIWAGIGGNYMVSPDLKNPLAGPRILKKFLTGPQDLSMTDTGNDIGRKMWEGLGGQVSIVQSMHWIRPLRPAHLALNGAGERSGFFKVAALLARPMGSFFDYFSSSWAASPLHVENPPGYVKKINPDEILELIRLSASRYSLAPSYSKESLEWILRKAGDKREYGDIRMMGVYTSDHHLNGWFIYYPHPGKTAQVLQVGTRSNTIGFVLDHLFHDAYQMKSLAVMGRVEPRFVKEFSERMCLMFHRSNYFILHSKYPDVLHAICSGDAFLTRLEGEWWTPLQGDPFD